MTGVCNNSLLWICTLKLNLIEWMDARVFFQHVFLFSISADYSSYVYILIQSFVFNYQFISK